MADEADTSGGKTNSKPTTAQLDALQRRLEKTKAQIVAIQNRSKEQARKDDTRLKVLVGVACLADCEHNEETRRGIRTMLDRSITAPRDREFLKEKGGFVILTGVSGFLRRS